MGSPLFELGQDIRGIFADGIDTLILTLGRPCRFHFLGTPCPNCILNPDGTSTNEPISNAAVPFDRPPCPVCEGTGRVTGTATTLDATFLVGDVSKNDLVLLGTNLAAGQEIKTLKGLATYGPQLINCNYIEVDTDHVAFDGGQYRLFHGTLPRYVGAIAANRYFTAFVVRS